ncbi:unnamed protein product, partial [Staurois parvus]
MVSWQKYRLYSQVPPMAQDCPGRPWKAAGASSVDACNCSCRHHPGITTQSPVMYQYVAGPCWVYMLCSFFICSLW